MKKAFTLAEIMIVLTVIGVLTAILLPVAFQAAPDENVMKFKKANSTLGTMIRELVNSDRYYQDGDLGMKSGGGEGTTGTQLKASGTGVDATGNKKYFCLTLADIMSTKSVNCTDNDGSTSNRFLMVNAGSSDIETTPALMATFKTNLDAACANENAVKIAPEIVSSDGISWYQASPGTPFGYEETANTRTFSAPNTPPTVGKYRDKYKFDIVYKVMCIDVDGPNNGEAPFGYGIRADGRIIPGAKADLWINKSVQQEN